MSRTVASGDRSAAPSVATRGSLQTTNRSILSTTSVSLEGEELEDYCKRRGLCPLCAKTRTRKRSFKFFKKNKWEMLTLLDKDGSYKVYKGYCVKPTCFTLDQAKRLAGELVVSSNPRRRNLQRKGSRSRSIEKATSEKAGDSDDDSNMGGGGGTKLTHKRNPGAFPPPELRNATNFATNETDPLFVVHKAVEGLQGNSSAITVLELSGLKLRQIDFDALAEGLKVNSTLSSLILENSELNDVNLSIIASGLEKASDIPLKKLYLRSNQLGDPGIDSLGPFLQANTTLEKLDVSRNCLTSNGAMTIFSAFLHNRLTKIRMINLSNNTIWDLDDDTPGIESFMAKNRSLRILNMEGNNLNDESVHALAHGLKNNEQTSLERLYLGWNSIGDEGAIALAEMLEVNTSLNVLGLEENQLHNVGARALLAAMDNNFTLKEVSGLWRNKIDRRFIIVAIRRLLLSSERSDSIRSKLSAQVPSNNVGPMPSSLIDFDSEFDDPVESSRFSVGGGTAVSTMTNDPDFADPSISNGHVDEEMPLRRGRKPTVVRVAPQHEEIVSEFEGAEEVLEGAPYDWFVVLQASPLVTFNRETGSNKAIPLCDVDREANTIKQAVAQIAVGKIDVQIEVATMEKFATVLGKSCPTVLHFSVAGGDDRLVLENGVGSAQNISSGKIKELVALSGGELKIVFVSSRNAKEIGQVFIDAGVPHVVCCKLDHRYQDLVGLDFVQNFYRAVAGKKNLKHSYQIARAASCSCPHARVQRRVAERFHLLPDRSEMDGYHNVPVFFSQPKVAKPVEDARDEHDVPASGLLPKLPQYFVGREVEMLEILEALRADDIVRITGTPGCGKDTVAAGVCQYAFKRRAAFQLDNIFWLPSPEGVIPQEDSLFWDLCQCVNSLKDGRADDDDDTLLDRIEIELEAIQVLLVLDERQFQTPESMNRLEKFISFVLNVGQCKVLLLENRSSNDAMSSISHVSRDTTGSNFDEATIEIKPLGLKATAQLFGEVSKFIASSGIPAAHDAAEFAELVEPTYLASSEMDSSLFSQRRLDLYTRMGQGHPAAVLKAATTMPKRDFIDLIGIANRPEVFVDSLSALDIEINRRNQQKSKAVDTKNYLRAMDLDTLIEELDSMRPEFPTLQDLKDEEEIMKQDLEEAVSNRRYDVAYELKRELLIIKKKIIKEQRSRNKKAALKNSNANDMAKELESQVNNMVLQSQISRKHLLLANDSMKFDATATAQGEEVTFAVTCGDHRDCSFVVCVGSVLDFSHPAEASGFVYWTNECCQLEGCGGDALLRMGGSALRNELSDLPVSLKSPYGPVRCATGNAIIMGPAEYGSLESPCIILTVGPLSPNRILDTVNGTTTNGNAKGNEREGEDDDVLTSEDSLFYTKTMLRSCYRSSMILAKHAELQALALDLSTTSFDSPSCAELLQVGVQTLVEEVQFSHLRDLHLLAKNAEEASLLINFLHGMGHRRI